MVDERMQQIRQLQEVLRYTVAITFNHGGQDGIVIRFASPRECDRVTKLIKTLIPEGEMSHTKLSNTEAISAGDPEEVIKKPMYFALLDTEHTEIFKRRFGKFPFQTFDAGTI